ncbi:MAG: hypothetical protein ACKO96_05025 [Flammeovirgaceae bacterium]
MTRIISNESFREWLLEYAANRKITLERAYIDIGEILHYSPQTVRNWATETNPKPLNARTAALIEAAIKKGDL